MDVVNHNSSEMTIYVVRDGVPTRIGRVGSKNEATFDLRRVIGDAVMVQLVAQEFPFGRSFASERMHVPMGGRVELRLGHNLDASSFAVR